MAELVANAWRLGGSNTNHSYRFESCPDYLKLKVMSKDEIKFWIERWSKLKPSPQRDMVIKIWSKSLK